MLPNDAGDEEEDFFQLIGTRKAEKASVIHDSCAIPPTGLGSSDGHAANDIIESSVNESAESSKPDLSFVDALEEFYAKHNILNLSKASYIASKFTLRRWDLWEQLCFKYRLGPKEGSDLWVKFHCANDSGRELLRRLFEVHADIDFKSDTPESRRVLWASLLKLDINSDAPNTQFLKHSAELEVHVQSNSPVDNAILQDISRTHQELAFFREKSVRGSMCSILQLYCRLNGVQYVQGMNELLAVVYFVMRDDSLAFWGFSAIMQQMLDLYTVEVDSTHGGIYSRTDWVWALLRDHNYLLYKHLSLVDFPLPTFAMRWITTFLATDLTLPDAIRLWDVALLSAAGGRLPLFATCLSAAYLHQMSKVLLTAPDPNIDTVELASKFGRGVELDIDHLTVSALSIYAYEVFIRGQYTPISDEPIIDVVAGVVDSAKFRVVEILQSSRLTETKNTVEAHIQAAGAAVSVWLKSVVSDDGSETTKGIQ